MRRTSGPRPLHRDHNRSARRAAERIRCANRDTVDADLARCSPYDARVRHEPNPDREPTSLDLVGHGSDGSLRVHAPTKDASDKDWLEARRDDGELGVDREHELEAACLVTGLVDR